MKIMKISKIKNIYMNDFYNEIGRRKVATARVYLKKGVGKYLVNKKELTDYFYMDPFLKDIIIQPLIILNKQDSYDFKAIVSGSGFHAQAEAIRLGISRALLKISSEYKILLKSFGLITRDPRRKEREKVGLVKARKRHPYRKR